MVRAIRPAASVIAATIFLLVSSTSLVAQQSGVSALSDWFGQSRERSAYRVIEPELAQIFRTAESLSLPSSLLINHLNLGAARRLPPAVLVRGMKEELARLRTAAEIVSDVAASPSGGRFVATSSRPELLNAVSIYSSGGLSRSLLLDLMTKGAASGRTADETFHACAVLLAVGRVRHFSDEELLALGASLLTSSVAPSGYAAVGSFIVRSIATGRGGDTVLIKVEQILNRGGGLPQMELELGRRR